MAGMVIFILLFIPGSVWSQTADSRSSQDAKAVTVIETNIGLDQIVEDERSRPSETGTRPQVDVRFAPNNQDLLPDQKKTDSFAKQPEPTGSTGFGHMELQDTVLLRLNAALRSSIEENQGLLKEQQELSDQLTGFVGQKRIDANRINSLMIERDAYKQQAERVLTIKERLEENISSYKRMYTEKEQTLQDKIAALKRQLAEQQFPSADEETALASADGSEQPLEEGGSKTTRRRSIRILKLAETLSEEQKRLKDDEGEIHYNMGNVFFHKGMYQRALDEYRMAVKLMPEHPNAHFNLAYVSSEFVLDQKTALHHYKQYLRLNPEADDADLVKEKILEAELDMQAQTGSALEKDLLEYRRNMYTYQTLGP